MKSTAVIVSALDHNYFHFLRDLLYSLDACSALDCYDFAVLDVGLLPEEVDWLRKFGVASIVRPDWPFPGLAAEPEWTKALYCRPFLPQLFPDWEVVVYCDADSWVQDGAALEHAVAGAMEDGFAAVPLVDRSHWPLQGKVHALISMNWHKQCLSDFYGEVVANKYQLHPIIMGGFFAGRRDAPHWRVWLQLMAEGLQRKVRFNIDQASMTLALHHAGLAVCYLPHYHHWVCHIGAIGLDPLTGIYVEPHRPHQPISALGLAAHAKNEPVLVQTTDGRVLSRLLRFGRQHDVYAVSLSIDGMPHPFDGIAKFRFRAQTFDAIGREGDVRFVQIGAMDGIAFDPIRKAVVRHGWQGILVEPLPDMMTRLQENYAGHAGLTFAPVAIAETTGTQTMQRVRAGDDDMPAWAQGLASLTPERNALSGRKISAEQHQAIRERIESVEVECLSFPDFAQRYAIEGFDVLQIDAEGYDYRILKQVDLARHAPKCVHMEIACLPADEIAATINLLRRSSYTCYAMEDGENLLALRRDFGGRHFGLL
jgi:FkbM family methyltransferase